MYILTVWFWWGRLKWSPFIFYLFVCLFMTPLSIWMNVLVYLEFQKCIEPRLHQIQKLFLGWLNMPSNRSSSYSNYCVSRIFIFHLSLCPLPDPPSSAPRPVEVVFNWERSTVSSFYPQGPTGGWETAPALVPNLQLAEAAATLTVCPRGQEESGGRLVWINYCEETRARKWESERGELALKASL